MKEFKKASLIKLEEAQLIVINMACYENDETLGCKYWAIANTIKEELEKLKGLPDENSKST